MTNSYGIIILAAGSSGRLGKPKQLLPYKGETLLQHLVNEARNSRVDYVVLVLGADAALIQQNIQARDIHIAINESWKDGMASSIRTGINKLQELHPEIDGAILMVCDQPYVTASLLDNLLLMHLKTGKPIVTSSFGDTTGPPALFHESIFPELLQLTGDKGARKIVEGHSGNVVTVPFPRGLIDIDTKSDYENLQA
jgi:molybdenum cofactor cytidylyltransferase